MTLPANADLADDYWALRAALNYASAAFEHDTSLGEDMAKEDAMLSRAWEALDAVKSRLRLP